MTLLALAAGGPLRSGRLDWSARATSRTRGCWVAAGFVVAQLPRLTQAASTLGSVAARLPFGPVSCARDRLPEPRDALEPRPDGGQHPLLPAPGPPAVCRRRRRRDRLVREHGRAGAVTRPAPPLFEASLRLEPRPRRRATRSASGLVVVDGGGPRRSPPVLLVPKAPQPDPRRARAHAGGPRCSPRCAALRASGQAGAPPRRQPRLGAPVRDRARRLRECARLRHLARRPAGDEHGPSRCSGASSPSPATSASPSGELKKRRVSTGWPRGRRLQRCCFFWPRRPTRRPRSVGLLRNALAPAKRLASLESPRCSGC